jgi:hypothetical protein
MSRGPPSINGYYSNATSRACRSVSSPQRCFTRPIRAGLQPSDDVREHRQRLRNLRSCDNQPVKLTFRHGTGKTINRTLGSDTVGTAGEVSIVHGDGRVTVRLQGYDYPITVRAEHLSLTAKRTKR